MAEGGFAAAALGKAVLYRIRHGHSHGKQEHREDDVRNAHSILEHGKMFQKMRHASYGPEIIDEDHKKHRKTTEHVYCLVTP